MSRNISVSCNSLVVNFVLSLFDNFEALQFEISSEFSLSCHHFRVIAVARLHSLHVIFRTFLKEGIGNRSTE